jgi:hypothetical protein
MPRRPARHYPRLWLQTPLGERSGWTSTSMEHAPPGAHYEAVRPCAPRRYSPPRSFSYLGFFLGRSAGSVPRADRRFRGDRFPRSTPEPEPGSRHLYAGHRLGSKQVLSQAHPEVTTRLGFDAVYTLSTRHQWFTRVRLPGSYLTHYSCALSVRSPPRLLTDAACGGLKPLPAQRLRRAHLHLWCSQLPSGSTFYIEPSFSLRGAPSSA